MTELDKRASMNDDRISEVYKGEIWTEEAQARARRRVNWMVSQAQGSRVLDLGCSQGIASILLGREGFEVVGVDVQESRIEYANGDLALEAKDTQQRVRFTVGNGADLNFDDDYFDTVLLGEVIEHLAVPDRVLAEVARVLKPGGLVVITTPFGVLRHHDHKQTFFPDDVFTLVSEHFGITSAEVEERYFRIVGEEGADSKEVVLHQLRDSAFETVAGIQEQLADTRIEGNRLASRLTNLEKLREKDSKRTADLTKRLEETRKRLEETRKRLESANEAQKRVDSAWRASNKEHEQRYRSIQAELKVATEEAKKAERHSNELGRVRRSLDRREQEVAKLRHRLAVSDWKLASLRRRRWMRLGSELSAARRRPSTVLLLPARIFKVIRSKTERLPRPTPPELLDDDASDSKTTVPLSVEAIVPARDVPALVMVDGDLRDSLSYEFQTYDLDREGWRSQLTSLAPSLLILDSEAASHMNPDDLDELLTAVRNENVRSILWDDRPEALPGPSKAKFDALCGDGKPPMDDFKGQVVERRGWIQPRLHNPVGAYRRPENSARVDLANRVLAQTEYESSVALGHAAKKYKVLRAFGDVDATLAAPILATATPLITTSNSMGVGIPVDSEEAAESFEKSLTRSGVLRARLTHPQMRAVMRERTIGRDIAEILGEREDERWPQVDIMVPTKRPHMLPTILENLGRQTYPNFRLFLVAHGVEFDHAEVQEKAEEAGVELAEIVSVDDSVILGEVFNIGFGETEADIVAKVDDDDFYGAEYLWDLYSALEFSDAEVAGKWAHYVYLEGTDSMIYRFKNYEHRFTDVVAISTLLMHREVFDVERFPAEPWGSGSLFLRALGAQGGRVFAADRWNYLYVRARDGERNTFPISDVKMLSNSDIVCKGMNVDEVVV